MPLPAHAPPPAALPAGYLLGGGFGLLGRYAGLACDSLTRLQLVLANGSIVEAAPGGPYEDLFWASCGGGGGTFGVATEFTLQLVELPGGASEVTAVEASGWSCCLLSESTRSCVVRGTFGSADQLVSCLL